MVQLCFSLYILLNYCSLYSLLYSVLNSLQLRNKNLIDGIQEEGKAIMDLNVKLKIIPIRRQLNLDETVSYWLYNCYYVFVTCFILANILMLNVVSFA